MSGDGYTKIMLTLIALCALALVGIQLQEGPSGAAGAPGPGRYDLRSARGQGGPTLIRLDTVTGRVWTQKLGDEGWIEISGEGTPSEAGAATEETPSAPTE